MSDTRLYIALTSSCGSDAMSMLQPLRGLEVGVKIGLELFVKEGPGIVEDVMREGFPVFLDLKFHDIPYTVAGAVRSACLLEPAIINVHASGGMAMMEAAVSALSGDTRLVAVTILTSMDKKDLDMLGFAGTTEQAVAAMASAAQSAGLHGVVCSPLEASVVRKSAGDDFLVITPGVRPAGSSRGDQKRVLTPFEAVRAGATALVVGRPVTEARDPAKAAVEILLSIERALSV